MNCSFSDTSPANEQTSEALVSPESETIPPPQEQPLDLPTESTSPDNNPPVQQENPLDIDLDYDKLVLTRGQDFDLDYTLLVPVMRANERQQLDLKGCEPGESIVPIDMMNDPDNHRLWQDSLITEPSGQQRLSSLRVWNWFLKCLEIICQEARIEEKKGKPKILLAVPAGCPKRAFTLILMAGGTRILYDLVPCISFRGWPQVAAPWLQETGKFWQRAGLRHSDAAGAFHLLPGRGRNSTDWRFCFARSEVQLKKLVPQPFMKVFYCWRTVLARALSRQKTILRPYALRAIFFWACDRVQNQYLSREDEIPSFFCGLIDDVLKCLLTRSCPSYFLPHVNLLDKTDDATILSLAQIILMVRSDPVEQIRNALEQVSAARGLTQVHNEQSYGKKRVVSGIDSTGQALYSHVRVNDPQVEESQESLAERVKKMVQQNKGSSISVFINPNDVTRAHFRVDEKFT
ncbi:Oidioi.mRNA.OKI2018_I69.PAR.g8762.t1.cds [Oikopleura dioica]|uniref:Oidioi.mRNA.OKI2018_I69.PAR.g8762.t1.cds n=1 Tax=Oikopleura dioica TaxID=34765 RepID=A0ABN7RHG5_OIKDI|nr:Oidioi.mRNA.OKI2018_I69.PAR.g8762.t1.cds [Oikopleura dioica]